MAVSTPQNVKTYSHGGSAGLGPITPFAGYVVGPESDGLLIVAINGRDGSGTITDCTFGGVPMTLIGGSRVAEDAVKLYVYAMSGVTGTTGDIVATFDSSHDRFSAIAYYLHGAEQEIPSEGVARKAVEANNTAQGIDLDCTTLDAGRLILGFCSSEFNDALVDVGGGGETLIAEVEDGTTLRSTVAASYYESSAAETKNLSFTMLDASDPVMLVVAVIPSAPSGGGTVYENSLTSALSAGFSGSGQHTAEAALTSAITAGYTPASQHTMQASVTYAAATAAAFVSALVETGTVYENSVTFGLTAGATLGSQLTAAASLLSALEAGSTVASGIVAQASIATGISVGETVSALGVLAASHTAGISAGFTSAGAIPGVINESISFGLSVQAAFAASFLWSEIAAAADIWTDAGADDETWTDTTPPASTWTEH